MTPAQEDADDLREYFERADKYYARVAKAYESFMQGAAEELIELLREAELRPGGRRRCP